MGSSTELSAVSSCVPEWLKEVERSYANDAKVKDIIEGVVINPTEFEHYTFQNGIFRYKGKLFLGDDKEFKDRILAEVHDSAEGGDSGVVIGLI